MNKELTFEASDGEKIHLSVFKNDAFFNGNSIVFVHGFKGFKDWGFGPYLAEYFCKLGYLTITFNFSHNGIGRNLTELTELEKFAKNTFTREIRELNEILSAVKLNTLGLGEIKKIGLIGHSRGGAVSLLCSLINDKIDAIALWASIAKLDRYSKRQKDIWKKKGFFSVLNSRTNQEMKLDVCLLEDIERNSGGSLNIEKAAKSFSKPLLIAHGNQDLAVKIIEAEQIYNWSNKSITEFFTLYNAGHTFDIVHPFKGTNEKFERLLEKTSKFFSNNFK